MMNTKLWRRAATLIVLLLFGGGCRHLPVRHVRPTEFPELIQEDVEQDLADAEAFDQLAAETEMLRKRLDEMEWDVNRRLEELRKTRIDRERTMMTLDEVMQELNDWRDGLSRLESRLIRGDNQRLDLLDDLVQQVESLAQLMAE